MTKLKIDRDEFISALTSDTDNWDECWFLDKESGELWLSAEGVEELPEDLEDNPRYLAIDPIESGEAYEFMQDFVDGLEGGKAADFLQKALNGRKPFRHFKDALLDFPELRENWFEYERKRLSELAAEWLDGKGIEVEWT